MGGEGWSVGGGMWEGEEWRKCERWRECGRVMVCTKTFSVLTKCTATMHGRIKLHTLVKLDGKTNLPKSELV